MFAQLTSVGISTSHSVHLGSNGLSSKHPFSSLSDDLKKKDEEKN